MEKMFHSASICLKLFIPALELLHLVSIHVSSGSESWLAQGVANTNNKPGGWEVLPTALNSLIVVSVSPCHKMKKKILTGGVILHFHPVWDLMLLFKHIFSQRLITQS